MTMRKLFHGKHSAQVYAKPIYAGFDYAKDDHYAKWLAQLLYNLT
jgi:hypothetical protein